MTPDSLDNDTDAQQLAASYGYDVRALAYQRDRRAFGSFTTTVAGAPSEFQRYSRAWQIAVRRR